MDTSTITGKEMCEYIVLAFPELGNPESIWNASNSGSLVHVFELFWLAKSKLTGKNMAISENGDITWQ